MVCWRGVSWDTMMFETEKSFVRAVLPRVRMWSSGRVITAMTKILSGILNTFVSLTTDLTARQVH